MIPAQGEPMRACKFVPAIGGGSPPSTKNLSSGAGDPSVIRTRGCALLVPMSYGTSCTDTSRTTSATQLAPNSPMRRSVFCEKKFPGIGPTYVIRDSPDDSRTGLDIRDFRGLLQGRREVRRATVISGSAIGGREADLAIFAGIWTHFSHR